MGRLAARLAAPCGARMTLTPPAQEKIHGKVGHGVYRVELPKVAFLLQISSTEPVITSM